MVSFCVSIVYELHHIDVMSHSQSTGQQLTVDDLHALIKELNDVRAKWYNIGVQLGVSVGTLKAIKSQCLNEPFDCLRETLSLTHASRQQSAADLQVENATSH